MAVKLTQAADTGLITAATRAGLAGAPASYSGTFEKVAKSYEKTMKAQGQMWKDIGKVVSVIGADMVANANEFIDYRAKGAALNPDSAKKLVLDLDANKQAQKDLGFGAGIFGDKETRQKKRELKMEQAELFAEIDMATESINTGAEAVAAGLYDHELAPQDAEMINAIIKSNLKDTFTENGSQAVLSREEKTNKLMFSLLDRNGNAITDDATGNPITMTMEEFNKSITTNIKDTKNVLGTGMSAIESEIAKAGQTSKSGIIDDKILQASLNNLDGLLQTDVDIKRAMLAKYGFSNTSFADDIKTKSKVSEDVYAALVKSIGETKGGQVKAEGVLANIDDTDGILGLSQEEINMSYGVYSANILGMKDPEISKEVFKASYADRMREAHKFGYSKRQVETSGGGGGGEGGDDLVFKDYEYIRFGNDNLTGNVAAKVLNDMPTGKIIDPQNDNVYNWKGDGWYYNDELVAKDNDALAKDVLQVRDQRFFGIPNPTTITDNEDLNKATKGRKGFFKRLGEVFTGEDED